MVAPPLLAVGGTLDLRPIVLEVCGFTYELFAGRRIFHQLHGVSVRITHPDLEGVVEVPSQHRGRGCAPYRDAPSIASSPVTFKQKCLSPRRCGF